VRVCAYGRCASVRVWQMCECARMADVQVVFYCYIARINVSICPDYPDLPEKIYNDINFGPSI
jgi:hypothetical protein